MRLWTHLRHLVVRPLQAMRLPGWSSDGNREAVFDPDSDYIRLLAELGVESEADTDGCETLRFTGESSSGLFVPTDLILNLVGDLELEHHVTHLHEVYHKALNESTEWGTALEAAFVYPPWRERTFLDLKRAAVVTHELFATFKSINLAELQYTDARAVLTQGSYYARLHQRAIQFLGPIRSTTREDLIITAACRAAMQSPILDSMVDAFPADFQLSSVRMADWPDHRLAWLLHNVSSIEEIVSQADLALANRFSTELVATLDDPSKIEDPEIDDVWDTWETVVYETFCELLAADGRSIRRIDAHVVPSVKLAGFFNAAGYPGFTPASSNGIASTDYDESVAVLSRTRFPLRTPNWNATIEWYDKAVDPSDFIDVICRIASVKGAPELVLHARLQGRLRDSYEWSETDKQKLADPGRVIVSAKCRTNIPESDELHIFHVAFENPGDLIRAIEAWGERGPRALCVSASCFVDPNFAEEWLNPLRSRIPVLLLLDVPTPSLVGHGIQSLLPDDQETYGIYWNLSGTPYRALIWSVSGHPFVSMYIGDSLSVQLMYGQLEHIMGGNISMTGAEWSEWDSVIPAVIRSLQTSESFLDLRALESVSSHPRND